MNKTMKLSSTLVAILSLSSFATYASSDVELASKLKSIVDENASDLMGEFSIPGLAVSVTVNGERFYYNYGVADKKSANPVTNETIFELGSISKTFAATLAAYAEGKGKLNMDDKVSDYIPELSGSALGDTKLVHVATYTAGGLPLQFPNEVTNEDEMLEFYKAWKPEFKAGTQREYSNPSIGLYGYIGSLSMQADYSEMMEKTILPELGMSNTFVNVPKERMEQYAFGYSSKGDAVRVTPGVLDAEAYGIKSTSSDMIRFLEANMGTLPIGVDIKKAIDQTHIGYFDTKTFTQAVGWEKYKYPVTLGQLLEGNSADVILNPQPVTESVSKNMGEEVWFNKTGSTGGFGAYVAYLPSEKIGVVILANKAYPNSKRVEAAYNIIEAVVK
ncbi:beta-lactamase/D-alanine carboxypeptidase [Vibrio parahaemolyticus]|uniref:class C beta-lactamase n=1 Tax=Vibrio parahaemolyticus TaxID=670 RepID=UPI0005428E29|nr:class C beta-lactamase [Vibrio parahaemolyticus]KHF15206.1 beta-lactamase/D-alanine carboxypeptidase [Vibrio parahaemolyticus]MDS1791563.1 class C beta-lactamase [Vibrio parahaemolyticus]OTV99012.1 class C beta-lactamase [Vibrio parahaemolyticus]OTW03027.1 class C beta-lactamase [Vibrio parahaemolyticus]